MNLHKFKAKDEHRARRTLDTASSSEIF